MARWASRRPMTAMLNTPGRRRRSPRAPRSRILATGTSGASAGVEEVLDLRDLEAVDAGRDRGVGGEDRGRAHGRQGLVEGQRLRGGHQLPDPLDAEEAGVALVGVEDLRRGAAGEPRNSAQRPDAADAEQHLLLQAVLAAAAVQAVGDAAGGLVVARHVGVEQQQRHPADLGPPDVRVQARGRRAAAARSGSACRCRPGLAQQGQRQPVGVEDRVGLLLPAVAGQRLLEVAGLVEQADADRSARRGRRPP